MNIHERDLNEAVNYSEPFQISSRPRLNPLLWVIKTVHSKYEAQTNISDSYWSSAVLQMSWKKEIYKQ